MSKSKTTLTEKIQCLLDEVADLQVENENIQHDSVSTRRLINNTVKMEEMMKEIDKLMGELSQYGHVEPISSRDGTFTAYEKTIGMSGVDMDAIMNTGLFEWFMKNHPECFVLDLRKAAAVLGQDLSGYALRPAYKMYTVSKDEDYRYIADLLAAYREEKKQEAGSS